MLFKKGHQGYWKGKKHPVSIAIREKIRNTLMGHKVSAETRKKISERCKGRKIWNKGLTWSEEVRKKISDTNKRKKIEPKIKYIGYGKDSPKWKGGVTPLYKKIRRSKEYKIWRTAVFERDNYTCIWCGLKGVYLHADHIKPFAFYPELRFAIDNGRTLCLDCHKKTGTYGRPKNRQI